MQFLQFLQRMFDLCEKLRTSLLQRSQLCIRYVSLYRVFGYMVFTAHLYTRSRSVIDPQNWLIIIIVFRN